MDRIGPWKSSTPRNGDRNKWGQARLFVIFKDKTAEASTAPDAEAAAASLQFKPRDFTFCGSFQGAELELNRWSKSCDCELIYYADSGWLRGPMAMQCGADLGL